VFYRSLKYSSTSDEAAVSLLSAAAAFFFAKTPQPRRIISSPNQYRHGELSIFRHFESEPVELGIFKRVTLFRERNN
jgi:hypothetical protein